MDDDEIINVVPYRDGVVATINMDKWSQDQKEAFRVAAAEEFDMSLFEGNVEHGYLLKYVRTEDKCPRCDGETRQQYGNFIYATDIATRVMFAAAGYFCTECPTVIIDEQMIEDGITGDFKFLGILGIDYGETQGPDFFRTWNGKDAIYVFDEDKNPLGISTHGPSADLRPIVKKHKSKQRNKMAKLSRKRNRKR